jgi:hypothetical protein
MRKVSDPTRLIPPPASPVAAAGDWGAVEATIGLSLPDDFKRVVEVYGTGRFFGFLWVYSPFDPSEEWSLAHQVRLAAENLQAYRAEGFAVPFPVHPEVGGLLNFGSTENGNLLNWITEGEPNGWRLAIWDPDSLTVYPFRGLTLAGLLCELAKHRRPVTPEGELFPEDMFLAPGFVTEHHSG